jgi:peroxiredoxin
MIPIARKAAAVAVLALLAVAGTFLTESSLGQRPKAPSVAYTLLDGTTWNTDALRGQVVLVNFWATSCTACVREMPQIVATHQRWKDRGLQTLAVAMRYDPPAQVVRFAEAHRLPFGVVIDNTGAVARGFGDVALTPTTILIDKRGRLALRYVGEPDFAALNAQVERLLAEG